MLVIQILRVLVVLVLSRNIPSQRSLQFHTEGRVGKLILDICTHILTQSTPPLTKGDSLFVFYKSMVVGSEDIDWQDLRKNTSYQGEYWDQHPVIKWFWEVLLNQCNLKQKKNFLRFLTGCDRVPIVGLPGIKVSCPASSSQSIMQNLLASVEMRSIF